jgi:hypothetical protein
VGAARDADARWRDLALSLGGYRRNRVGAPALKIAHLAVRAEALAQIGEVVIDGRRQHLGRDPITFKGLAIEKAEAVSRLEGALAQHGRTEGSFGQRRHPVGQGDAPALQRCYWSDNSLSVPSEPSSPQAAVAPHTPQANRLAPTLPK